MEKWTTRDELEFIDGLYRNGKLDALRSYLQNARMRKWHGDGMDVEPGIVINGIADAIRKLEHSGAIVQTHSAVRER